MTYSLTVSTFLIFYLVNVDDGVLNGFHQAGLILSERGFECDQPQVDVYVVSLRQLRDEWICI